MTDEKRMGFGVKADDGYALQANGAWVRVPVMIAAGTKIDVFTVDGVARKFIDSWRGDEIDPRSPPRGVVIHGWQI